MRGKGVASKEASYSILLLCLILFSSLELWAFSMHRQKRRGKKFGAALENGKGLSGLQAELLQWHELRKGDNGAFVVQLMLEMAHSWITSNQAHMNASKWALKAAISTHSPQGFTLSTVSECRKLSKVSCNTIQMLCLCICHFLHATTAHGHRWWFPVYYVHFWHTDIKYRSSKFCLLLISNAASDKSALTI